MQVHENFSLKQYNTFGIDAVAKYFAKFSSFEELLELRSVHSALHTFTLGGGSNILLTHNFNGLVLKNEMTGIEKIKESSEHVYVRAGAGENWHSFVTYCISQHWAGVENLSLIPGNVGASPMQNIGAYGVEIREVFEELTAFDTRDNSLRRFDLLSCEFGYRESVFKRKYKDRFVILDVTYRLDKSPKFNTSYGAIEQELQKMGISELSIEAISQAVINIRRSKLPDPAKIGNAGSFFKNPTVQPEIFEALKLQFPGVVGYKNSNNTIKLAAAWLIEQCGWKGYRKGDAGCHPLQALVLVNYANATGDQIYQLSEEIVVTVQKKFDITLEREVNII